MSDTVGAVDLTTSEAFAELRLSPEQASAMLAEKVAAFKASESRSLAERTALAEKAARDRPAPVDSGAARARLADLTASPEWRKAFFGGNIEAKNSFRELTAAIAAGSAVADALAGAVPLTAEIQTTTDGELTSHKLAIEVGHLRELGLNDDVIKQAIDGRVVTSLEREQARQAREMCLGDKEFVDAWTKGGFSQRRQMTLLSLILSSEVAA